MMETIVTLRVVSYARASGPMMFCSYNMPSKKVQLRAILEAVDAWRRQICVMGRIRMKISVILLEYRCIVLELRY